MCLRFYVFVINFLKMLVAFPCYLKYDGLIGYLPKLLTFFHTPTCYVSYLLWF